MKVSHSHQQDFWEEDGISLTVTLSTQVVIVYGDQDWTVSNSLISFDGPVGGSGSDHIVLEKYS